MNREYIPVLVEVDGKKELWRVDVTDLNVTQLIELKEDLLNKAPYSKSIQALDSIIKRDVETIIPTHNINSGSYIRECKKTRKEEKIKIRTKSRRKRHDKYKR